MIDKVKLEDAINIVNNAILELNNGDASSEDFYWWNAALETLKYRVGEDGKIYKEK